MKPTLSTSFFASAPCELVSLPHKQLALPTGLPDREPTAEHLNYVRGIEKIRDTGESRVPRYRDVRMVLYPCSAFDTSIIGLFPHVDTFIGVDAHPFVDPCRMPTRQSATATYHRPFYHQDDVHALAGGRSIGGLLLSTLATTYGAFQLVGVNAYRDMSGFVGKCQAVHGEVLFRLSEQSAIMRYIHLNADVKNFNGEQLPWWLEYLNEHLPDAVVVKGAMGTLHGRVVRERIVNWLVRSGGILIEGEHSPLQRQNFYGRWELVGDERFDVSAEPVEVSGVHFGYRESARITSFTPQS